MNEHILKGKWKQLRGNVKEAWGKLTDDDLDQIDGASDQLAGKLQERYGYSQEKAQNEVAKFLDRVQNKFEKETK
jgi:uncharacterized protein YjbJ (UPF0337 family)